MSELLNRVITIALLGFVVSSTIAMGVSLTVGQIFDALRNARLVTLAMLANFVVMPLAALALARALRLDEPLKEGLLLLGTAAGAPFLPKLAELAKGNLPFAVGIMALLTLGTVGYLPLVLPLLLSDVTVDSAKIARSLSLLMLLPLAAGLALKAYRPGVAARVKPFFDGICGVSLIPLVLLLAFANVDKIYQIFGTRGILAGLLLIMAGFGIRWLLGDLVLLPDGSGPRHWTAQYCRRARGGE